MNYSYIVNNKKFTVSLGKYCEYKPGKPEILIEKFGDLTRDKNWFEEGFSTEDSSSFYNKDELYESTRIAIKKIVNNLSPTTQLSGFTLEQYHQYVPDELHPEVIKKTRRIFPEDLGVDINKIVESFSQYFQTRLSFSNPVTGATQWMIARINRPRSNNYNTVHKDIYEAFDKFGVIPKMVNIWIPLCGVIESNSLPIVPKSHLLPENAIVRTKAGSVLNGVNYSVASIKSWNGSVNLQKVQIKPNELLVFSSHLIHGLAFNSREDTTRVSFEFRLYEEV